MFQPIFIFYYLWFCDMMQMHRFALFVITCTQWKLNKMLYENILNLLFLFLLIGIIHLGYEYESWVFISKILIIYVYDRDITLFRWRRTERSVARRNTARLCGRSDCRRLNVCTRANIPSEAWWAISITSCGQKFRHCAKATTACAWLAATCWKRCCGSG